MNKPYPFNYNTNKEKDKPLSLVEGIGQRFGVCDLSTQQAPSVGERDLSSQTSNPLPPERGHPLLGGQCDKNPSQTSNPLPQSQQAWKTPNKSFTCFSLSRNLPSQSQPKTIPELEADRVERRKRRLSHRLMTGLKEAGSKRWRFLTLTSSLDSPLNINRSFHIWQKRLLRKYGFSFQYLAVKELNKAENLIHLHIVYKADKWIDFDKLQAQWLDVHKAHHIRINRITGGWKHLRNYLVKYLLKTLEYFKRSFWYSSAWLPKGWREVWRELWRKALIKFTLSFEEVWNIWNEWLKSKGYTRVEIC